MKRGEERDKPLSIEEITPEKAQKFIKTSNQKSIQEKTILKYVKMFQEGYEPHKDEPAIEFVNGSLKNGNHRLRAIIRLGKPLKLWILRRQEQ